MSIMPGIPPEAPLQGSGIALAAWDNAFLPALLPLFRDEPSLRLYQPSAYAVLDLEGLGRLLSDWNDGDRHVVLAILEGTTLAGLVNVDDLDPEARSAEVGLALLPGPFRGRGIGRKAMECLLDYLFGDVGLHRLQARIHEENKPSLRLFDGLGFRREGVLREAALRDGVHRDLVLMSLLGREWRSARNSAAPGTGNRP